MPNPLSHGSSESIANGDHYQKTKVLKRDVGLTIDPFWLSEKLPDATLGQMTIIKKAWRLGSGDKDVEQDLRDIIGAANRMLEIHRHCAITESE